MVLDSSHIILVNINVSSLVVTNYLIKQFLNAVQTFEKDSIENFVLDSLNFINVNV